MTYHNSNFCAEKPPSFTLIFRPHVTHKNFPACYLLDVMLEANSWVHLRSLNDIAERHAIRTRIHTRNSTVEYYFRNLCIYRRSKPTPKSLELAEIALCFTTEYIRVFEMPSPTFLYCIYPVQRSGLQSCSLGDVVKPFGLEAASSP